MELSFALLLVTEIFSGNGPFERAQRVRLTALLLERPPIPGITARLVATPKSEGGFDWVSPDITDANFPATIEPSLDGAQLDAFVGLHVFSVAKKLRRSGRRAANTSELLLYGVSNPSEQLSYWIYALGQIWVNPANRCRYATLLFSYEGGHRHVSIAGVSGHLGDRDRVLSFPMTPAELAQRDAKDAARRIRSRAA